MITQIDKQTNSHNSANCEKYKPVKTLQWNPLAVKKLIKAVILELMNKMF